MAAERLGLEGELFENGPKAHGQDVNPGHPKDREPDSACPRQRSTRRVSGSERHFPAIRQKMELRVISSGPKRRFSCACQDAVVVDGRIRGEHSATFILGGGGLVGDTVAWTPDESHCNVRQRSALGERKRGNSIGNRDWRREPWPHCSDILAAPDAGRCFVARYPIEVEGRYTIDYYCLGSLTMETCEMIM